MAKLCELDLTLPLTPGAVLSMTTKKHTLIQSTRGARLLTGVTGGEDAVVNLTTIAPAHVYLGPNNPYSWY